LPIYCTTMDVIRRLSNILNDHNIDANLIDERARRMLGKLPEDSGLEALNEFERALRNSREKIINPSGYLMGVVRRLIESESQGLPSAPDSMNEISFRVSQKMHRMMEDGIFTEDDIDGRCRDGLKQLSEPEALAALDEVHKVDRSKIANITGYLMGVLRRFRVKKDSAIIAHGRERREGHMGDPGNMAPPPELLDMMGFLPAPPVLPVELTYGYGDDEYIPEMPRPLEGLGLSPTLQEALGQLILDKMCTVEDFDDRVLFELTNMPEPAALAVIREFQTCDLSNVRNVASYLIGIIKRVNFRGMYKMNFSNP